ncbi:MAG TPA: murein biosynthesis integral membrane protein MurJ [Anaerolineae bacterium]|nr:murein biosynthesis integral membrane protein MurJ [Anaerolineae bacterium]
MSTQQDRNRHIALNTLIVAGSFFLAAGAGLARNIVIAQHFTIGPALDAYYAAFRIPDLLFTVVAGGALATAFIPVFADFVSQGDREGAWRLTSAITNLVVLVALVFAAVAAMFAQPLVEHIIAPGFSPAHQMETAGLMRIVLISTILFAISSVQGSALHGFKHFLLPALAPAVYPLGVIAGALWLTPIMGVRGLAVGAVLGAALHLGIKVPALLHFGFRWFPILGWQDPAVRRVGVLLGPRVLDLAVFQLTLVLMTNLASRLTAGSVSALEWGWDAMQLPETIIGTAFGLVAFPTLAELAAREDREGLKTTLAETTRAVVALTVPATAGLILLGRPALQMVYQRGAFDAAAIEAIYVALAFFALGLVGHATLELTARAFFAQKDTVTPLLVATLSGGMTLAFGVLLMPWLGHGGLALGNSLATTLEVIILMLILRKRWGSVDGRSTFRTLARVSLATIFMALMMSWTLSWVRDVTSTPWLEVLLGGAVGLGSYVLASLILRERALTFLPAAVLKGRV